MITTLLIIHGLLAVALLGATTHQAASVRRRRSANRDSFVEHFQSVGASVFPEAIVVLFVLTAIGGAFLYPQYRLDVRPSLEEMQLAAANGVFEIKEHLAAMGLGLLPAYWHFWKHPLAPDQAATRRYLTWLLAAIVWWSFIVGHVLNNIKGLQP